MKRGRGRYKLSDGRERDLGVIVQKVGISNEGDVGWCDISVSFKRSCYQTDPVVGRGGPVSGYRGREVVDHGWVGRSDGRGRERRIREGRLV